MIPPQFVCINLCKVVWESGVINQFHSQATDPPPVLALRPSRQQTTTYQSSWSFHASGTPPIRTRPVEKRGCSSLKVGSPTHHAPFRARVMHREMAQSGGIAVDQTLFLAQPGTSRSSCKRNHGSCLFTVAIFAIGMRFKLLTRKQTSGKVSAASGMGVLSVDYRTTTASVRGSGGTNSSRAAGLFEALDDIVAALKWLRANGASKVVIYGDSSGSTQALETLLYIEREEAEGRGFDGVSVDGAALLSAWLDMTSSNPHYDYKQWCDGKCHGVSSPVFRDTPGRTRQSSMCQARAYTINSRVPADYAIASPMQAPPYLLSRLPPILLLVPGWWAEVKCCLESSLHSHKRRTMLVPR